MGQRASITTNNNSFNLSNKTHVSDLGPSWPSCFLFPLELAVASSIDLVNSNFKFVSLFMRTMSFCFELLRDIINKLGPYYIPTKEVGQVHRKHYVGWLVG